MLILVLWLPSLAFFPWPSYKNWLSLNKIKININQLNPSLTPSAWMWNPKQAHQEDDDSWEVRAFAEDTGNILGTTWPPRSYTCNFCRREFRSAQALGGHMNVHRRDRARLHQAQPSSINPITSSPNSTSSLIIPSQEFLANGGGLCLLYQLPNYNTAFPTSTPINTCIESPSTLLSISPYPPNNLISPASSPPPTNFPLGPPRVTNPSSSSSSYCYSSKPEQQLSSTTDNYSNIEDLDLELRLGQRPMQS